MIDLFYIIKSKIATIPYIYVNVIKLLFFRIKHNFPNKKTDIFIFAYPRSGNDYAKQLIKNYNNKISISSHYHRPAMLLYAIKLKIPVIVIFRNPIEAISSSMIKYKSELNLKRLPIYPLNDYIMCHKIILQNKDKFSLINFNDLINNPEKLFSKLHNELSINKNSKVLNINDIVKKAKTKLNDADIECNNIVAEIKGPDVQKDLLKNEAKEILLNNKKITTAQKIYEELLSAEI